MSKLAGWIKQHQVLTFYLLVFIISWPSMVMLFWVFPQNVGAQAVLGLAATFSPALVALLISNIAKTGLKRDREPFRWFVFVVGWLFTWAVLMLHTWQIRGAGLGPQVVIPSGVVALLPAWLMSCAFSRIPGVRDLWRTLLRPRGHWTWYLAALLIVPAVQLIGAGITILLGNDVTSNLNERTFAGNLTFIILTFLFGFLTTGGINEETGWRGFVLPRLQARFPVLGAITIVWFFWALWHIPYDIGNHTPLESILMNRILFNFMWAVLFAWVYNRTRGSLLAPAIFHPAMNTFGNNLPATDAATALFVVLVIAVILHERMWKKLPAEHPAVHA